MNARLTLTATATGVLCLVTPAYADTGSNAEPSGKVETVTPGGELVINIRKWARSDRGPNTGLIVWYSWEGTPRRRATVMDGSSEWVVRFADRPEVGKQGQIDYTYVFEITDAQRRALDESVSKLIDASTQYVNNVRESMDHLAAATQAAQDAPENAAKQKAKAEAEEKSRVQHERYFPEVNKAATPFKGYADKEGNPGPEVMLKSIGFEKDPGNKTGWKASRVTLVLAADTADLDTQESTAIEARDRAIQLSNGCNCLPEATELPSANQEATIGGLEKCAHELATVLKSAPKQAAEEAQDQLTTFTKQLDNFRVKPDRSNLDKLKRERRNLGKKLAAIEKDYPEMKVQVEPPHEAMKAQVNHLDVLLIRSERKKRREPLVARIEEARVTLSSTERASDILKQEGQRRDFDVASGLVYTFDLDDFVIPILVAWCPWGCRRPEAGFEKFRHGFSVDLGLRTAVLDRERQRDPRHDTDTVSPMLGMSLNPTSFVRLSLGFYYFSNAQTARWNFRPYAGVTMDLVRLAEVTKLVGLGEPPKPQIK